MADLLELMVAEERIAIGIVVARPDFVIRFDDWRRWRQRQRGRSRVDRACRVDLTPLRDTEVGVLAVEVAIVGIESEQRVAAIGVIGVGARSSVASTKYSGCLVI